MAADQGPDRWIAGTRGAPLASRRRREDFPRSPLAAWEAAVTRGRGTLDDGETAGVGRVGTGVGRVGTGVGRVGTGVGRVGTGVGRVGTSPQRPRPPSADTEAQHDEGVEGNARLTGMTAAVLLVLFALEGLTILRIRELLTAHVVIGMLLVPPVLVKIASTGWRFARYYLGSPQYRRKGAPPPLLRLLGPFVVVLTVVLLASGIALLVVPGGLRGPLLTVHKASFVLWFLAMAVHVLGHVLETARLAPRDFYHRTRGQVRGARARQWLLVAALGVGLVLAMVMAPKVGPWLSGAAPVHVAAGHSATPVAHAGASGSGVAATGVGGTGVAGTGVGGTGVADRPAAPGNGG